MIRFHGGEADGEVLRRVVDLVECIPLAAATSHNSQKRRSTSQREKTETIFVYRLDSEIGRVHLCRGRQGGSGWYVVADYTLHDEQPSDAEARDNCRWQEWARGAFARVGK